MDRHYGHDFGINLPGSAELSAEENPYAASSISTLDERLEAEPASATRRFWNFVIDLIAIRLGLLVAEIAYGLTFGLNALKELDGIEWWALYIACYIVYYSALEIVFGRTLGKVITGTRVVTTDGHPLWLPTALVRTVCRLIPLEPVSFTLSETWWHDSLSKTQVVLVRRAG